MKDLTEILISARKKKVFPSPQAFLTDFYAHIPKEDQHKVAGDIDCGERWIWVSGIAMFHVAIGIGFVKENVAKDYQTLFDSLIIPVYDFSEPIWCLDIAKINEKVPELYWAADRDAVNPEQFSIQELYYATV